jgi:hypothetical protein
VVGFDADLLNKLPHIFCIEDVDLSIAQRKIDIEGVAIEPGIRLSGKFMSRAIPVGGEISLAIIPPTLAQIVSKTTDAGLQGEINLEKINLLGGLIKITSVDGKSGPLLHVSATAKEQAITGGADVVLVSDKIFHEQASLSIDSSGLFVTANKKIMGFGVEFTAQIPVAKPEDIRIWYTFTDDISSKIQGRLGDVIKTAKDKANEEFHKGMAKIEKVIKFIPEKMRNAGILQGILDQIDAFADTLNKAFDKVLDIGKISIQKVMLGAQLGDFSKGLLSGTVDCTIFGKQHTFNLSPFVADSAGLFVENVAHKIVEQLNPPGINVIGEQLKSLGKKIKQAFGLAKKDKNLCVH